MSDYGDLYDVEFPSRVYKPDNCGLGEFTTERFLPGLPPHVYDTGIVRVPTEYWIPEPDAADGVDGFLSHMEVREFLAVEFANPATKRRFRLWRRTK